MPLQILLQINVEKNSNDNREHHKKKSSQKEKYLEIRKRNRRKGFPEVKINQNVKRNFSKGKNILKWKKSFQKVKKRSFGLTLKSSYLLSFLLLDLFNYL